MNLLEFAEERRTAHEFARDTLRRAIVGGAIPGGTRLVQAEIAEQLKVSTTPVREALRDLASDGLIVFDPHRGAIIHELDAGELVEVYEIRKALEPLAIRKAAQRINEDQMRAATALQQRMDTEEDPATWAELNWEFHSLLERSASSPRFQALLKSVQDIAAMYVAHSLHIEPRRVASGNREHWALLDALSQRDADRAASVLVKHLDGTLGAILASGTLESSRTKRPGPRTGKGRVALGSDPRE